MCAIGGYSGVGKNMTALRIGDEVVIIDIGVNIEALVTYEREEGSAKTLSAEKLIDIGAIPNDRIIKDWSDKVVAIVLGHCHLDHIAAVQYLAPKYKCPVIGSDYTIEVLKSLMTDNKMKIPNKLKVINLDSKLKLTDNITVEIISTTHSTMRCGMVTIHTPEGIILYANDFKLDNDPVIGCKPNYKRLKELGESNKVIGLICDSLYAPIHGRTQSESVARDLLKDILLNMDHSGKAIFITTFSSHIQRLHTIIECGKKLNRKVVILGRSMAKYIEAAEKVKLVDFSSHTEICKYGDERRKKLREIEANRDRYLVICTGGQGEPGAILDKIVNKELKFNFRDGDIIIFSCKTIPVPMNIANRERLEKILKTLKVRIFTDVHSSGHAKREHIREFIDMVKPKIVVPSHGDANMESALVELAEEMGYKVGETVFHLLNGQKLVFKK